MNIYFEAETGPLPKDQIAFAMPQDSDMKYGNTKDKEKREAKLKDAQQAFISKLQSQPFVTVKCRPLRYTPNKKRDREKGIDILLATDMLSQAYFHSYDSLILISGDGDYAPVLEEIKKMGKRVENAFLCSDRSDALRRVCDIFIDLDDKFLSECLIKKAGPRK